MNNLGYCKLVAPYYTMLIRKYARFASVVKQVYHMHTYWIILILTLILT